MNINEIMAKCQPNRKPETRFVYCVLNRSGLGDNLARLTVFKYIKEQYPWVNLRVVVPDYLKPIAEHCLPDIRFHTFAQAAQLKQKFGHEIAILADKDGLTTMRMPLVTQAYVSMLDHLPMEPKHYNYIQSPPVDISKFKLPKDYVVIPIMCTAPVRELSIDIIEDLVEWCFKNSITPIFAGKSEAPAGNNFVIRGHTKYDTKAAEARGAIDLIDKTTLVELASVLGGAKAVVGLDNGLLHLAACTDVAIVFGFSTVDPRHRIPYRHDEYSWNAVAVTPPESLECRFCQSNMNFVYDHDFKFCFSGEFSCLSIPSSEYINALEKAIQNDRRK